jgi:putative transcriptional regulator
MTSNNAPIIDTLTGSFLVSTPRMPDPRFEEQVILICAHSHEGAMGVAVNKPNPAFSLSEILNGAHLPVPGKRLPPVYIGGPVELESAFILYQSDYQTDRPGQGAGKIPVPAWLYRVGTGTARAGTGQ